MSAFLVKKDTIDRIITCLDSQIQLTENRRLKEQMQEMTGVYTWQDNWRDKLGTLMLNLNQMALGERYNDKMIKHTYKYYPRLASQIQYLKSLQCFNYQCMEGAVIETKIFKFFDEIFTNHMFRKIVYSMPTYDQAEWA